MALILPTIAPSVIPFITTNTNSSRWMLTLGRKKHTKKHILVEIVQHNYNGRERERERERLAVIPLTPAAAR